MKPKAITELEETIADFLYNLAMGKAILNMTKNIQTKYEYIGILTSTWQKHCKQSQQSNNKNNAIHITDKDIKT